MVTNAPERIFAAPPYDDPEWSSGAGEWDVSENWAASQTVKYIRADKVTALVEALQCLLRFAENTESELGIVLDSADLARAALAAFKEDTKHGD